MIKDIGYLPIFNSRGDFTIQVWVTTSHGNFFASAPSGKSRGKWEAKTLSLSKIKKVFPKVRKALIEMREDNLELIDEELMKIGGKNLGKIGANLSIAVSMACTRAASKNKVYRFSGLKKEFPYPLGNVLGGGVHGGYTSIQEFLVIPKKAKTIEKAIETNFKIWKEIGAALRLKGINAGRNDEGAWFTRMDDFKTLDLLTKIAEKHGAKVGLDMAASEYYKKGKYIYDHLGKKLSSGEQLDFVENLIKTYKLGYVEDPFHQNDFLSFAELRKKVKCMICGDDLFVTNPERLSRGILRHSGNTILIKPDQIGTITKTLETVRTAKNADYGIVVSHRSGETSDPFIADFAVNVGADLIKCGVSGGERVSKLNRLLEIWSALNKPEMKKLRL